MTTLAPRILVIRRDNIGDLVCTTPLLAALRRQLPQARIEFLATRYNQAVLFRHPHIDALHAYTKAKHRQTGESLLSIYRQRIATILELRRRRFDWVLLPGGANVSSLRFAHWIAPRQIAVRDKQDQIAGPHEVQQCCHLITRLGLNHETPPTLVVPDRALASAALTSLIQSLGSRPKHLIALHISARKPSQRWPADYFVTLTKQLHTDYPDAAFLLLWSPGRQDNPLHPGDDEKATSILAATADLPVHALPTYRLEELIAALSLIDLMVCGDGGAMHLAAALGKPVVALFGQSDTERWHPWNNARAALQPPSRNVSDISVNEVQNAIHRLVTA